MREICDYAASNWISDDHHDDWDSGGGPLDSLGCNRTVHDDYLNFALDQICGQFGYPIVIAVDGSPLDHHITPLGVAYVPEFFTECLHLFAFRGEDRKEYPNVPRRSTLLRISGEDKFERPEADGQNEDSECEVLSGHRIISSACSESPQG